MRRWIKTGLLISVFIYSLPSDGKPCNSRQLPTALFEKIEQEDFSAAEAEALKAVKKNPASRDAQVNLAKVYINAALRPVANFDFAAMGIDPNKTGVPQEVTLEDIKRGVSDNYMVDEGYREKAENQINLVLKRWPESKSLLYCLTKLEFYSGVHDQFLQTLYRSAEAFSDEEAEAVGFFLGYGQEYFKRNELKKNEEVYRTLLKVYPNNAPLLSSLGVSYMYQGRTSSAVPLFDRAYKQAPEDKIIIGNIGEISMLTGDFAKAEKFLKLRAKMTPTDSSVYFDLAMNAMHKGVKNSLPYWDVYFEKNKEHPDDKQWSHAAKVIRQTIKDGGMSVDEQIDLADQMIERMGAAKYAIAIMSHLQRKYKSDAAFPYQLAHAYDRGEYYDLEEKSLLETYKRLEKQPSKYMDLSRSEIHYNLARTSYALGNYSDSLKYLDKMQKSEEEEANTGYMYGLVYLKMGKVGEAKKHLELCSHNATSESIKNSCKQQLEKF